MKRQILAGYPASACSGLYLCTPGFRLTTGAANSLHWTFEIHRGVVRLRFELATARTDNLGERLWMPDLNPFCRCVGDQSRFCKMCEDTCLRPVSDNDLYDPPNTVEAFNRLIAAIDPVRSRSSVDLGNIEDGLLDPPTTADRFARIEAAIEASLAKLVEDRSGLRYSAKSLLLSRSASLGKRRGIDSQHGSHRLKKRPSQLAMITTSSQSVAAQGNDIRGFGPGRTAEHADIPSNAVALPMTSYARAAHSGKDKVLQDVDIFRNSAALREFTAQTYDSARERYMYWQGGSLSPSRW